MSQAEAVKRFVRGKLGCVCEDCVFQSIRRSVRTLAEGRSVLQLEIGGRLLVQVISPVDVGVLEARLPDWIEQGVAERDAGQLNRFRLVLGASDSAAAEVAGREIFTRLAVADERVHLHVLPLAALGEISRE